MAQVVCLRPLEDFVRVGVTPPDDLSIVYRPSDSDLTAVLGDATAVVLASVGPPLETATLRAAPGLRLVQFTGAGVDRVDVAELSRRGVTVASASGANAREVAEYVVLAAGTLLRRLAWADREIRRGRYREVRARMVSDNLPGYSDLVVGVVGMGHIGVAVARVFSALGASIAYFDPQAPPPPADVPGIRSLPLPALLEQSDIVTLHVPLLAATRGLIDGPALDHMKPGAVLIQASRGGVVDEQAAADRLMSGALGGMAVDVYAHEPPDGQDPLLRLEGEAAERVLFTPHIAGVTRQSTARLSKEAWENVHRVLVQGLAPRNVVSVVPA